MILTKHVKKFIAQVEEKVSFDKYNINNSIDSINLNTMNYVVFKRLSVKKNKNKNSKRITLTSNSGAKDLSQSTSPFMSSQSSIRQQRIHFPN